MLMNEDEVFGIWMQCTEKEIHIYYLQLYVKPQNILAENAHHGHWMHSTNVKEELSARQTIQRNAHFINLNIRWALKAYLQLKLVV